MLTVLYKDADGNETLHEAESVQRIVKGQALPDGPSRFDCEPGVIVNLRGEARVHYAETKAMNPGDKPREIFVMNEAGATVARYTL